MDRKSEEEKRAGELIRQAESARGRLTAQAVKLRGKLDVPARLRSSLSGHPGRWMAGSMFSGMAASLLLRRKRKSPSGSKGGRGALLAVLAMLTTAARPLIKAWMLSRLKDILSRAGSPPATSRPVARPLP